MSAPAYIVGRTLRDGTPCILTDGDTVVATFPQQPGGEEMAAQVCALLNREGAESELIEADREYDAALAAMRNHYRAVAEFGYVEVHVNDAREISERFVRADMRRADALARVGGVA